MNYIRLIRLLAGVALPVCVGLSSAAQATETWPTRPIRLVVGYPPGGANDQIARHVASRLERELGQTVVVENRPGADGVIGTRTVAQATPDGHTLALAGLSPLVLSKYTFPNVPYDSKKDLVGATTVATSPILLAINPELPVKSFGELVAYAKAHPGKLNFATAGTGGSTRVMLELFKQTTDVDVQYISYNGGAQALTDVVAGRVDAMAIDFSAIYPMVRQGKLRAIAITSSHRNKHLPEVPTVRELGYPKLEAGNWYAVVAPSGTPRAIIDKLNATLVKLAASNDMREAFDPMGIESMTQSSSEAFSEFLSGEFDRWGAVVTSAGIKAE